MYELTVSGHFSAAHHLRGYRGKCENLHGHNWKIEALVSSEDLDKTGMALDFTILKKGLRAVLALLDHRDLNKIPYFQKKNPSAENIARFIFEHLKNRFKPHKNVKLKKVTAWESPNSSAAYSE